MFWVHGIAHGGADDLLAVVVQLFGLAHVVQDENVLLLVAVGRFVVSVGVASGLSFVSLTAEPIGRRGPPRTRFTLDQILLILLQRNHVLEELLSLDQFWGLLAAPISASTSISSVHAQGIEVEFRGDRVKVSLISFILVDHVLCFVETRKATIF